MPISAVPRRRDFLAGGGAGALALALPVRVLAARDESPAGAPSPEGAWPTRPPEPLSSEEIARWTEDLDARVAQIDRGGEFPAAAASLRVLGLKRELLDDTMHTLATVAALGALPELERERPEVQRRLRRAQPRMDRALGGMSAWLRARSDDELLSVGRALHEDPGLGSKLHDRLVAAGFRAKVPRVHLRRFSTAWDEVTFRMAEQDPVIFARQALERADRRLAAAGLDWRSPGASAASAGAAEARDAGDGDEAEERPERRDLPAPAGKTLRALERRQQKNQRDARGLGIAAPAVLGSGSATVLLGALHDGILLGIGLGTVTLGVVLLVIALVVALVAAEQRRFLDELRSRRPPRERRR